MSSLIISFTEKLMRATTKLMRDSFWAIDCPANRQHIYFNTIETTFSRHK